jgi:hypothetical protein
MGAAARQATLNPSNTELSHAGNNTALAHGIIFAMGRATIAIGPERFRARFRGDLAPHACGLLQALLPYHGDVIHSRWSGEAIWSPLGAAWSAGSILPPENATAMPKPGDVLLYAGSRSEPELLFVYGLSRFACKAGPLEGNPVLVIEDDIARLVAIGREILWKGALPVRIELDREET